MQKTAKDYIIFPLDFPAMEAAQSHIRQLDGRVGMFKIGLELFIRQGPAVVDMVKKMSGAGIFLDLKLHDISATVGRAMARVADLGVDLVTVHGASSPKMLKAAVENAGQAKVLAVTLLTDNDADTVRAQGFKDEYVTAPEKTGAAAGQHGPGCRMCRGGVLRAGSGHVENPVGQWVSDGYAGDPAPMEPDPRG